MSRPLRALVVALALCLTQGAAASAVTWPMFHGDRLHSGLSSDTAVGAASAPTLGIGWEQNLGDATYASPVVGNVSSVGDLVFVGNSSGVMSAYDALSGARRWWHATGAAINSTAAYASGRLWFGSSDHFIHELDASTGKEICSFDSGGVVSSSPVLGNPDGKGQVVYFGNNGLTGADDGGAFLAVNAANCSMRWRFTAFGSPPGSQALVGSWSPPAFATLAGGRTVVVFGSSSPEGAVYCLDATTGSLVWRFQTYQTAQDQDVGAGPTVSAPGVNGYSAGAVYVAGKDNVLYDLNLATGAMRWGVNEALAFPGLPGSMRSTAALAGATLFVGYGDGLMAVDARTGATRWSTAGGVLADTVSSPSVSGASGDRVVIAGDTAGRIWALSAADGAERWSYDTGSLIYSSPAVADGSVFMTSSNGFLYRLLPGGPTSGRPDTTITSPADGAALANPNGTLTASGTATDDKGVASVQVAVRMNGKWWDAAAGTWDEVFTTSPAVLAAPGKPSTAWSFAFPVTAAGGPVYLQAVAVDGDGQMDPTVAAVKFTETALGDPPDTTITSPVDRQIFTFPLNPDGTVDRVSFPIGITGSAVDTAGTTPGVRRVVVLVENIEHAEYYCGPAGCPGQPGVFWRAQYTTFPATVASPGATATAWSASFPTYDHPHKYKIAAWAIDMDGVADPSHASVPRICVADPGLTSCV